MTTTDEQKITAPTPLPFSQLPAYHRLASLAQRPPDLTESSVLSPERLKECVCQGASYKLLYGTERISEQILSSLVALADEAAALPAMAKMQQGAVVNAIEGYQSERRPALHTALRDLFDSPQTSPAAQHATEQALAELKKIQKFLGEINRENRFTDLIIIGIGGSELGPQAVFHALEHLSNPLRRLHFLNNIDPDASAAILKKVDLKRTLVALLSKGGTTLETLANEQIIREAMRKAGVNAEEQIVAVTQLGSPIDLPGRYRERFYLWDWVGGRYSVTSAIGAIPLGFCCGFDTFFELLRGANAMDKVALHNDIDKNPPLLGALLNIWNHNFLRCPTLAIIPYSQRLLRLPAHIQQVEMESNGKRIDRYGRAVDYQTGTILFGEPGTNAQHSFFQLLHQGTTVVPVEFIAFKESAMGQDLLVEGTSSQQKLLSNLFAQAIALAKGQQSDNPNKLFPGNRPSHILLGRQVTPFSIGALLAYFEHKTAFESFVLGINAFDQEGVQLGKRLANDMLARFSAKGGSTPVSAAAPFPLGDAFLHHLDQL